MTGHYISTNCLTTAAAESRPQLVRTVDFGSGKTEGVVADDFLGVVYASEETTGVWKIPAEPDAGSTPTLVDGIISEGGHLQPDIEGPDDLLHQRKHRLSDRLQPGQRYPRLSISARALTSLSAASRSLMETASTEHRRRMVSTFPMSPLGQPFLTESLSRRMASTLRAVRSKTKTSSWFAGIQSPQPLVWKSTRSWNPRDVGSRATGVRIQSPGHHIASDSWTVGA
ncbi:MAG: hypothetical protein KatS3mg057_0838 [Herpetosiphonaceae bacterium]|nr:MAG: hypothetical protein KatS3mg057_0838 [Herpetosiphonaceae bacterium]